MTDEHGDKGDKGDRGPRGEQGKREGNPFVMAGSLTQNVRFVTAMFLLLGVMALLLQVINQRSDDQQLLALVQDGAAQRQALAEQAERIIDCTDPAGKCFAAGQDRTADAIAQINVVTEFAVICGESEDGEKAILECVNTEVKDFLRQQAQDK